jgi:hypothetical protein
MLMSWHQIARNWLDCWGRPYHARSKTRATSSRSLALSWVIWIMHRQAQRVRVGKIPNTRFPNPNYPNPDPKYPITISDSDSKNPKLVWVIRVMFLGTRTTQITQNISNICSSIPNTKTWSISMPYKYIIWYELM